MKQGAKEIADERTMRFGDRSTRLLPAARPHPRFRGIEELLATVKNSESSDRLLGRTRETAFSRNTRYIGVLGPSASVRVDARVQHSRLLKPNRREYLPSRGSGGSHKPE